jgi:FlaA1/EpsC-like NDP-sugar epimerase
MKLYKLAKENIERFLGNLEENGYKDILLYGAGEVAETILSVIRDKETLEINIVGLIDDDLSLQNNMLMGYRIIPLEEVKGHNHDAIVITSYTYEDSIRKRLEEVGYDSGRVIRFFQG